MFSMQLILKLHIGTQVHNICNMYVIRIQQEQRVMCEIDNYT